MQNEYGSDWKQVFYATENKQKNAEKNGTFPRSVGIARPDFVYHESYTCVFIDGSIHQYADIASRDARVRGRLATEGYTVIAFPNDPTTWPAIIAAHPGTFGTPGTQR